MNQAAELSCEVRVLPAMGRDGPASPPNALTAVAPGAVVSFSSTRVTVSAMPLSIRRWHSGLSYFTSLPSGPTIRAIGLGGQWTPRLASVPYADAISSGLV